MAKINFVRHLVEEAKFRRSKLKPPEVKFRNGGDKHKFLFYFSPHRDIRDVRHLFPIVEQFKPHVVCIEHAHSTLDEAKLVESMLTISPHLIGDSYHAGVYAVTRPFRPKVIVLERFDPQEAKRIEELYAAADEMDSQVMNLFYDGKLADATKLLRESLTKRTEATLVRERFVKDALHALPETVASRFPDLASQKQLRVLVAYGGTHSSIFSSASEQDRQKERFITKPNYLSAIDAHLRRASFRRPSKLSEAALGKSLANIILAMHVATLGVNRSNANAFGCTMAKNINTSRLQAVSQELEKLNGVKMSDVGRLRLAFKKSGVVIPRTKLGVHSFLREHRIPLAQE
ncbi:MAG: hypothetical protein V1722_01505 [Candidatus Micrarchaeota archaeon]